ncbi:hypothetical protein VZT92_003661 [Zoarces viviparus]|uniref:Immunoglobulin subtype domain-containing protein n=1 Tax=Zoarces viviparus TaxID=48416 RepID=A0AAW1FVL8_ZOAVI
MSIFVILGLLVCIEAQGSSAVTTVFVQKGDDLILNVGPKAYFVKWKFNERVIVVFDTEGGRIIDPGFTGRIEFPVKTFSVKLKNLQEADSGVYAAQVSRIMGGGMLTLAEYKVTVQGPVSPVELTVDSVDSVFSRGSDSCNLTVTCSTQHSHISSTFRCVSRTCSQEGGEQSELTTSGASLHVYLMYGAIICNHSNQVTNDFKRIEPFCPQCAGSEGSSAGTSVYLVKMVVFSVGLIIMVFAVITVHLMEKFKKHK